MWWRVACGLKRLGGVIKTRESHARGGKEKGRSRTESNEKLPRKLVSFINVHTGCANLDIVFAVYRRWHIVDFFFLLFDSNLM